MSSAAKRWFAAAVRVSLAVAISAAVAALPAVADVRPNDPFWSTGWSLQKVGLPAAWSVTTGSPTIVIAVVDTGVEPIADLDGALVPGWDFVDGDAIAQDTYGHGTEVASIIAARGGNGTGIAGVCWACSVMPIRVAVERTTTGSQLALGIRFAADHGARIINVSLEGGGDTAEAEAVAYAQGRGALVIASAGNGGDTRPGYPAAYPGVVAVAATDQHDRLYPWSTRGAWVSLAAPGCSVVDNSGAPPVSLCGTSLTPAIVSGIAGLLLSANPTLGAASLAAALHAGAVRVAGIGGGRVDAGAAMRALTGAPPSGSGPSYVSEARLLRGTMRATWRTALQLGPGPLVVELRSHRIAGCVVELRAPHAVLIGLPIGPDEIRLADNATGGRYVVGVACSRSTRRAFTLLLYASVRR